MNAPTSIRLDRLPPDTRAAILAIYEKSQGKRQVTVRQVALTDEILTRGSLASGDKQYANSNAIAFSRVILKWLSENATAKRLVADYVKHLQQTGQDVRTTAQTYGEFVCDQAGCEGRVFHAPQGLGTHRRMAHGISGKARKTNGAA